MTAPETWIDCRLSEIADVIRGVTYSKGDSSDKPGHGRVALLRATNIDEDELVYTDFVYIPVGKVSPAQWIRRGDIVLAASSGSASVVGKSAPVETDWHGTFGAFCAVVRAQGDVNPRWLAYRLQAQDVRQRFSDLARGVNINNLKRDHLLSLEIQLPPHEEQRRIVEKIQRLFGEIHGAASDIREALALEETLGDSLDGLDFSRDTDGWREAPLGDLLERLTSGSRDWKRYYNRGDGVFLLAQNVRNRRLDFSTLMRVDPPPDDPAVARSAVRKGDVLITIVGAGTGTVAHVGEELKAHYVCQSVALLRPLKSISGAFLELFLTTRGADTTRSSQLSMARVDRT